MKRIIIVLLCLLMVSLSACSQTEQASEDSITVYYRSNPSVFTPNTEVIVPYQIEFKDIINAETLLEVYFSAPNSTNVYFPFPTGTQVLETTTSENVLTIKLSDNFTELTGVDRTLACACIAKTITGLTEYTAVTILSGDPDSITSVNMTLSEADITLIDNVQPTQE